MSESQFEHQFYRDFQQQKMYDTNSLGMKKTHTFIRIF